MLGESVLTWSPFSIVKKTIYFAKGKIFLTSLSGHSPHNKETSWVYTSVKKKNKTKNQKKNQPQTLNNEN